ncbi:MAG: purine-nucleoside phosphorylase, partial [Mycobacteriaceae bacterium]
MSSPSRDVSADPARVAAAAAEVIARRTGCSRHDAAVVLGSGWRPAADVLGEAETEMAMADLPGFAPPSTQGQEGTVRSLQVGRSRVLVLLGRTHPYEGHGLAQVV